MVKARKCDSQQMNLTKKKSYNMPGRCGFLDGQPGYIVNT